MRLFLSFLLVLTIASTAAAGGTGSGSDRAVEASLDWALALYEQGDLHRAMGEAKRFLFFRPEGQRAEQARELLEKCRIELGRRPASGSFTPWRESLPPSDEARQNDPGNGSKFLVGLIHFYQEHLRTFRRTGASCPSYPSCSTYAIQAIDKHGPLLGVFIFVDRYVREVTSMGTPPMIEINGRPLHYDPVEFNDYWLTDQGPGAGGNSR